MVLFGYIEPLVPSENHELEDLAFGLVTAASGLASQLNPIVRTSVGDLVRSMNCYYSNLIEGHNTLPRDIERALHQDYSPEPQKRNLQLEAVAHIEVQRQIDSGVDHPAHPASVEYLRWLHREFCSRLPDELLWVENPDTHERFRVTPGEIRNGGVKIGLHVPPIGEDLSRALARFEEVYTAEIGKFRQIIAVAAAHHRMLWIHPFLDGNGRVARLMVHALLKRLGVGSSLWSVSRGLARQVSDYKILLMAADRPRDNDSDGRGCLSERALVDFCRFFLTVSLDQVRYMESILDPGNLLRRIELYCTDEVAAGRLPKPTFAVLREVVLTGELERGRVAALVGLQARAGRHVTSTLLEKGLLLSDSPRAPLRLGFPTEAVERWFPALYPTV